MKADQTIYAISREYNVPVNRLLKTEPNIEKRQSRDWSKIKLKENKESYGNQNSFSTAG